MSWDDLAMVNLQSRPDGTWSYTAYRKPFNVWRTNKGLSDVFCCIEDLMKEIAIADDTECAAAVHDILMRNDGEVLTAVPPAGEKPNRQKAKGKAKR